MVYAVPSAPGRCRLFGRFPFKFLKGSSSSDTAESALVQKTEPESAADNPNLERNKGIPIASHLFAILGLFSSKIAAIKRFNLQLFIFRSIPDWLQVFF